MATWNIDPDHSCAAFAIRHMALAHVRGQFAALKGTIEFDPADRTRTAVNVEIEVASVSTGTKKRDEHLLTSDFFDQPKYPLISFKSSRVDFPGASQCRVTGNLTIHGVTRPVTFEGEYAGPRGNPYGDETSIGFSGTTNINREDFGIMWGSEPMESGGLVAGKEVQIFLDVEADMVK
jgi:polyisoprenoid-binding protein YceI